MKWFDRQFSFNHLDGTFPSILERLEGTPLRLKYKIQSIPSGQLTVSIDGSWSIKEHVGHLGDLESLWESRYVDFIKKREVLTEADLTNQQTYMANHNQNNIDDLLNNFEKQRIRLCCFLRSIGKTVEVWYSKHPRLLIPMRPIDLAYFIAEHDDHHLASISEIHRRLQVPDNGP
jgi:uncharacterized damage-inducible protein DinB